MICLLRLLALLAFAWAVALILLAALFNLAWWAIWTPAEFLAECALCLMREREN